jgi:hypothetical protein
VAAIASGGAPERVLTALLFAGLAWAVSYVSDALANDPAAYQAARIRLRLMLDEAMDFGELLWLADDFAGGAVGIQMERDTDAAQLRKYQRAVEAWEVTHAPVIQAWAQAGPTWDETGTRNMFAEVAPQFRAFAELFGQRMAAVLKQIGRDAGDA